MDQGFSGSHMCNAVGHGTRAGAETVMIEMTHVFNELIIKARVY